MLSRTTIDQVTDLPLDQVISKYVVLKKQGSSLVGKSPFTEEKSGSFHVSMSKGCWKCFSTGKGGGNAISFVMEKTGNTFVEVVKELAQEHGIALEYDDSEKAKAYEVKVVKVKEVTDINAMALDYYISKQELIPKEKRRATDAMYERFSLGYAPDEWAGLMNHLLAKGYSIDQLVRSGLIVKSSTSDKHFDFFRGRIMFPVFSVSGKILGFSGRNIIDPKTEDDKNIPKILNSKETDAYIKSQSLLGIFQAKQSIINMGFACLVEGNFDVTSFHEAGMENTIGPLGTAFTKDQAKLIRKYTDTVVKCADNDKAGLKAIEKDTLMLLEEGFKVSLFIPEEEGQDPDDVIRTNDWSSLSFVDYFEEHKKDALEYLAEEYFKDAKSVVAKSNAEKKLTNLLSCIADAQLRNSYIKHFSKTHGVEKASVEKSVSIEIASRKSDPMDDPNEKKHRLPSHLKQEDQEDFKERGFYEDHIKGKTGYYFPAQGVGFERISNFTIKPYFQVRKTENSPRIVELKNDFTSKLIIISNKAFVSSQMFEETVMNEGNFNFIGSKKQYQRIRTKLLDQFPVVDEITTLGWQSKGFYAFANGIVDGNFKQVDPYGICHYKDEKFFLPAFSKIYLEAQDGDDKFETDRHFKYDKSNITFSNWSNQMYRVHGSNALWGILYVIAAIYRDYIFSINNSFPLLFNFGLPQTGKSTCARSLNSVFFGHQPAFFLPGGTAPAFNRRLARVKNAVAWFDEYRNDIDPKRVQALKGSYDGTGHEKAVMSNDNKTIAYKINSSPILSGQYYPTVDQGALSSRCIILEFTVKAEDRSIDDSKEFDKLLEMETEGLSDIIIEIVKYRDYFIQKFATTQFEINSKLKTDLKRLSNEGRVMNNYTLLITVYKIFAEKFSLPMSFEEIYNQGLEQISKQSEQISSSNDTSTFWKIVQYLSWQSLIRVNEDYIIDKKTHVKVREGRGKSEIIDLGDGENVIFIRFSRIHGLYMENFKKQNGENGVVELALKSQLISTKAFIGSVAVVDFDGNKTSAYAFRFDMLGISLKGWNSSEPTEEEKESELPF